MRYFDLGGRVAVYNVVSDGWLKQAVFGSVMGNLHRTFFASKTLELKITVLFLQLNYLKTHTIKEYYRHRL